MDLSIVNTMSLADAAVSYAIQGFRVFPCRVGGREPMIAGWPGEATDRIDVVKMWWDLWPQANIGLAMGHGWAAVDLDVKHDQHGDLSFELAGGPLDRRWPIQVTPSGGRHHLIRTDETFINFTRRGALGGVDMRTTNGYICASPSVVPEGRYAWSAGGNPGAEIPEGFLQSLRSWSAPREVVQLEPMPEPTEMADWEVDVMLARLGGHEERFLRTGEGATGDNSKDAYWTCRTAFKRGWTLADMARIGPETVLAYFGGRPPHGAANPWQWAWKYTVARAWSDHRLFVSRMFEEIKESPEARGAGDGAEEVRYEDEKSNGSIVPPGEATVNLSREELLELFKDRAYQLARHDYQGLMSWLRDMLSSGLDEREVQALLYDAKASSGYGLGMMRNEVKAMTATVRLKSEPIEIAEIYVRDQGKFFDRRSKAWITKEALVNAAARNYDGDLQRTTERYLTKEGGCEIVESVTYHPGLPSGVTIGTSGALVYNKYVPTSVAPVPGDIGPWLGMLQSLQFEGGEEVEKRLVDELAWIVQNTGKKLNHGILIGGAEGIGKDSLIAPFLDAIGRHNVKTIVGEELSGSFSDYLGETKVLVVNEIRYGNRSDKERVAEILKPLLAAPPDMLRVNEKNIRPYQIPNVIQMIGFSNHRDALHVDTGSRRYFGCWSQLRLDGIDREGRAAWDAYFESYWKWLDNGGREAVVAHLLSRDVRRINHASRPLATAWVSEMMQSSHDPVTAWIAEQLNQRLGPFAYETIPVEAAVTWGMAGAATGWVNPHNLNGYHVGRAFMRLGCQRVRTTRGSGAGAAAYCAPRPGVVAGSVAPLGKLEAASNVIDIRTKRIEAAGQKDLPAWLL